MRAVLVALAVCVAPDAVAAPRNDTPEARTQLTDAFGEIAAHMHALRYADALASAELALRLGAARRDERAQLARLLGTITASLGDAPAAESWFAEWIAIDTTADLPAGTSPKLMAPFLAARGRATGPLSIHITIERPRSDESRLVVGVTGVPGTLVQSVSVATHGETGSRSKPFDVERPKGAGNFGLSIETAGRFRDAGLDVSLRDTHGNEVLAAGQAQRASANPLPRPIPVEPQPRRPLLSRPLPYAVSASLAGGLGAVFLWRRSVATDDLEHILANSERYTFADAEAARARAERHGWLSAASFTAAGVLITTTVIMAYRDHEASSGPLLIQPTGDGAMIIATTTF